MLVTKVVYHYEVEPLTRDGWTLKEILSAVHVQRIQLMVPFQPDNQNGYVPPVQYGTREELLPVSAPLFVLTKETEVETREQELDAKLKMALNANQPLIDSAKSLTETVAQLNKKLDVANARVENVERQLSEARTSKDKLERDITKIRQAIGTMEFDAILK